MAQIPFLGVETSANDTPFLGSQADTLNLDGVELKIRKGIANGYAPLDGNAKVPVANLPDTTSLDAEVDGKITTHNSATTSVHGIANTANLVLTNDSRLADSRQPTAHTHTKSEITDFTHTHAISDVTNLQTSLDAKFQTNVAVQDVTINSHLAPYTIPSARLSAFRISLGTEANSGVVRLPTTANVGDKVFILIGTLGFTQGNGKGVEVQRQQLAGSPPQTLQWVQIKQWIANTANGGFFNQKVCFEYDGTTWETALDWTAFRSPTPVLIGAVNTSDLRLSDSRTPTSHTHGNITNSGSVGTTANLPLITTTSGVVTAGSFGTTANSFCQGNDPRLSDNRTPTAHKSSHATGGTDALSASDIGAVATTDTRIANTRGGSIDTRAGAVTERTYETGDPEDPTGYETSLAGGNGGTITLKGGDGGFDMLGGGIGGNSGSINLSGYTGIGGDSNGGHGGSITLVGGWDNASAGSINLNAGSGGANHHGGSIISTGSGDFSGGTLNMSANTDGAGGSINTSNKGGSINTSGYDANIGGSLNLSGGNSGAGGFIDGKNKGGFIKFYGTGTNPNGVGLGAGGSINISAGPHSGGTGPIWATSGVGGNGGSIQLLGGAGGEESNAGNGGNGGTIIGNGGAAISIGQNDIGEAILGTGYNGGTINFSAGSVGAGGSIDTSNGGGSINTRGVGSIQLGVNGTRTTIAGSASGSNKTITLPDATGTIALTNDSRFTDARTPTAHTHGNITNDGKIPIFTTSVASITAVGSLDALVNGQYIITQGANVTASAVVGGTTGAKTITLAGNVGNGYANGSATINGSVGLGTSGSANVNITIGSSYAYGQPLMTGNNGVVGLSSFGTTAYTFCQGNDVRLGARTVFTLGGDEKITYALGGSYVYGGQITRGSKISGGFDQTGLYIQGNWTITGLVIMANYPSAGTAGVTYGLVKINNASSVTNLWTAPSTSGLNNGLNTINNNLNVSISDGDKIGFQLTIGSTAGATVPTNLNPATITANLYCVPR